MPARANGEVTVTSNETTAPMLMTSSVVQSLANGAVATGGGVTISPVQVPEASTAPRLSELSPTLEFGGTIASARGPDSHDMTAITATFGVASNIMGDDPRFVTIGFPMSPFPFPENLSELDLPHGALTATTDDSETDESLSGPLAWIETDVGFLTWMSLTQTSGRSNGSGSSPIFAELAAQVSSGGDLTNPSGLSFLATAGSATLLAELSASRADKVALLDQGEIESETTAPILDAGIPLSILSSITNLPIPTEQGGVEQVAELIPLSQSSLALAATLWTVRSEFQPAAPGSDLTAGAATDPIDSLSAPAQWAVFMTGVDRAFEQTFRDVQLEPSAGDGQHKKSEEGQRGVDDSPGVARAHSPRRCGGTGRRQRAIEPAQAILRRRQADERK